MAVKRGAAIVQIAVTRPVVIKTTSTHPGTSPRSSLSRAKKDCWIVVSFSRKVISATKARFSVLFIFPLSILWMITTCLLRDRFGTDGFTYSWVQLLIELIAGLMDIFFVKEKAGTKADFPVDTSHSFP